MVLDASKCGMCLTRNKENKILNVYDKTYKLEKTVQKTLKNYFMRDYTLFRLFRSSHPGVLCKKSVLRNFAKFTGKHFCQSLYFNKVAALRLRTSGFWLFKKYLIFKSVITSQYSCPFTSIKRCYWYIRRSCGLCKNMGSLLEVNIVVGLKACNIIKKKIKHRCFYLLNLLTFDNTYFEEHLRTTVSDISTSRRVVELLLEDFDF